MTNGVHPFLQPSPYESDASHLIGRDPRTISEAEWAEHMPEVQVGMRAIRAKCIECSSGSWSEALKCVCFDCPLWALRLGSVPKGLRAYRRSVAESDDDAEPNDDPVHLARLAALKKARAARAAKKSALNGEAS